METDKQIIEIQKEDVFLLHFPDDDILFSKDERKKRERQLDKASALGNIEHHKVKILFQDIEGLKQVHTTIWGVTDTEVILKKGVTIPTQRIYKIQFI